MIDYDLMSTIFFVLGIISFVCFLILAIKNHLVKLIADLLGITAKRKIKLMKSDTSRYNNPSSSLKMNVTDRIVSEQTETLSGESCETTVLENISDPKFVLESEIGFHDSDEIIK
ncbi:MAG: hypothetical protein PUC65_03685 [Clostridiales bacterium]|nr:hypothetical protein [Clostridiales bacterium]